MKIVSQDYSFHHGSQTVSYQVCYNAEPEDIKCVVALGSGQIAKLPSMVASALSVPAAVIQGLPHWHASEDGSDLTEFTLRFAQQSITSVAKKARSKVTLIAESQAAPSVVILAEQNPDMIKSLILIQPLGLNAHAFLNSQSIIQEFKRRVRLNAKYHIRSMLIDGNLIYNNYVLLTTRLNSKFKSRFETHYEIGLKSDITNNLAKVSTLLPVHIIIGSNDQIFRPDEISKTIEKSNIHTASVYMVEGVPHSPLVSRAGRKLLKRAEELI